MNTEVKVVLNKWGGYRVEKLPSDEDLQAYYRDQYYQMGHGSYEVTYSEEETRWNKLKADMLRKKAEKVMKCSICNMLDVGCGEGWLMDSFHQAGCRVSGVDYSIAGLQKFHPHLCDRFIQGDLYTYLDDLGVRGDKYDIVGCCNVVEHVTDPEHLILGMKKLLAPHGCLMLVVPNDFSKLHQSLLDGNHIDRPWWIKYPDHLSYFNKESMERLLKDVGMEVLDMMADHPIDMNLLNDNSNYIRNTSLGKATHYYRVRYDNFLASIDVDKLIQLYSVFGSLGVGRNLTYYARVN